MFPDKTPSEIYGIEHFLRLFGKYEWMDEWMDA